MIRRFDPAVPQDQVRFQFGTITDGRERPLSRTGYDRCGSMADDQQGSLPGLFGRLRVK